MEINNATSDMLGKLGTDPAKFLEKIKMKHAEAQLRLAREKDKPKPDAEKIGRYEKEVQAWQFAIEQHHMFAQLYENPESALKEQLAAFNELLASRRKVSESEVKERITFKDNVWRAIFFRLVEKRKDVKTSRQYFLIGERSFEKA